MISTRFEKKIQEIEERNIWCKITEEKQVFNLKINGVILNGICHLSKITKRALWGPFIPRVKGVRGCHPRKVFEILIQ